MKRLGILILALAMTLSLSACGEKKDYEEAVALYEAGDFEAAKEIFAELGEYEQASVYAHHCDFGIVGSEVLFGFTQEPYIVLDVQEGRSLLLADTLYAYRPDKDNPTHFGSQDFFGEDSWEESSIRQWLNGEYLEDSFTYWEDYILQTEHDGVKDYVFCLTAKEAEDYFAGSNDRQMLASQQVLDRGTAYVSIYNTAGWWLMPEGGEYPYVDAYGDVVMNGTGFEWDVALRPAFWLDHAAFMPVEADTAE